MTSDVSFHEAASEEFEAALEWYYLHSEFVASRFEEEMSRAIAAISDAPKRWPTATHGVRKFVLQRFPFVIFYRQIPSGIQVLV
jgi:plasmid stabilization system protein ParE